MLNKQQLFLLQDLSHENHISLIMYNNGVCFSFIKPNAAKYNQSSLMSMESLFVHQ